MKVWKRKQRLVPLALAIALLVSLTLASASGLAVVEQEILQNGGFENGFTFVPGCGNVGNGWHCFTNGGDIEYGFYDDQWAPVVAQGTHAQLLELNTVGFGGSQNDRYSGIYQNVKLVKGAKYEFKMQGLMREQTPDSRDDPFRYRVQFGYTDNGSTDWTAVNNWVELPWNDIYLRTAPGAMLSFNTSLVAPSDNVTIFIRVWKKWATTQKELDVDLDAISLWGPQVGHVVPCLTPECTKQPACDGYSPCVSKPPCVDEACQPKPKPPETLTCGGPNLVKNGNFESGFTGVAGFGDVGTDWWPFNNGGAAGYGMYNEMWPPVVKSPVHGQLIEINTKGLILGDNDRVSGIYQVVRGLKAGATYQFSMWGELREDAVHTGDDPFRYRVQYGFAPDGSVNSITNWTEVPWDTIYVRTSPGPMSYFSAQIQAPSNDMVLAVRAWKKWGNGERELDVNLDDIALQPCAGQRMPEPPKPCEFDKCPHPEPGPCAVDGCPAPMPEPVPGQCITYVIQPGDSLGAIAVEHGTTVAALASANNIANPDIIYVGQKLVICTP